MDTNQFNNQQPYGNPYQQNINNRVPQGNMQTQQTYPNQVYPNQTYGQPYQQQYSTQQKVKSDKKTLSIITLILGIISLICCCFGGFTGFIGVIIGIVAIIKEPRGKVISIIGTCLCGLALIVSLICLITGFTGAFVDGFKYGFDKGYNGEEIEYDELYDSINKENKRNKGNKDDHFWGSKYELYGCSIYFYDKGTFTWYTEEEFDLDNMVTGEYEVLFGKDAEKWLTKEHTEYGVTKQELREYAERNQDSDLYTEENLTILIIEADTVLEDGEIQNDDTIETYYYGYSNEEGFDSVNLKSFNTAIFTTIY